MSKSFLTSWWRGSKLSTIRNGRPASSHRAVFGGPVFRLCGLRFALCPRGFSRFAASDESRTPLLIGLTTACFRHRRRPSCAPALTLARCSASADALWACPRRSSPSGLRVRTDPQFSMVVPLRSQARLWHSLLHWAYFGLFRALRAAFVRPAYGGPVFRRCALRVLAPPAASRPPTASGRGGNAFFPQTQAFALQKMPEMTYTPSFLI